MTSAFDAANEWVGRQLAASSGPETYLLLVLGGALASLLPCVYPLYPITAAILRDRQSKLGRFAHPLAYYAGLCAIYFAFGLVASLAGGAFNGVLRMPAANLVIGVTLVLLAFSTVGLLHFPMLVVEDSRKVGLASTFAMGAAAGLLSSACVGPVVVSILVGIAATASEVGALVATTAALKMCAFGAGVGSPLLLIGFVGLALPRGGRWMVLVQWAFGLLIGYVALGYVAKGLLGLGFSESAAAGTLVGASMVLVAAFARQDPEMPTGHRMKRALTALLGVVGFFTLGRAFIGSAGAEPAHRVAAMSSAAPAVENDGSLTWHLDKDAAYREAATSGRPVFVDFHADWCTNCKAFQERVRSDEPLRAALQHAVLLKVRDTSPLFARYRDDSRFPELRIGLPFFVITDPEGELLYKTNDFTQTDEMALFLTPDT